MSHPSENLKSLVSKLFQKEFDAYSQDIEELSQEIDRATSEERMDKTV